MHDDERRILINARTAVSYVMAKPVHERMAADPRLQFFFMASAEPRRTTDIRQSAASRHPAPGGPVPRWQP